MEEKSLQREKAYLAKTMAVLTAEHEDLTAKSHAVEDQMVQHRREIWEAVGQMDEYEQAQEETAAEMQGEEHALLAYRLAKIERQLDSPYFGEVDFGTAPDKRIAVYVGLGQISDRDGATYVVDWRAPIADLYYNHDVGPAYYIAPMGKISGEIYNKYQFKIERGALRYVVDTSTTILDEVLLSELSKNASPVMRNIVATIQKEQNAIIRHSFGEDMLVQGVAGSGKTSIALHRIAYILYHSRSSIQAKDIWILTPNKAFTAYIGNVLPELGEQMVPQLSLDDILRLELRKICEYETRDQHLETLYKGGKQEEEAVADMHYKASTDFVKDIEAFVAKLDRVCFHPKDFVAGGYTCTKQTFRTLFAKRYAAYPAEVRIRKMADYVEREMAQHYHSKVTAPLHYRILEMVQSMYTRYDLLSLYRRLVGDLIQQGKPLVLFEKGGIVPYQDALGLLYLKMLVEGSEIRKAKQIKHLVVDEMQDYTPTVYAYLNRLFACRKTVLGDVGQMADPYLNIGDVATARAYLGGEDCALCTLETSYRSSYEIATFANRFAPNPIHPIDRHDDEPVVARAEDEALIAAIRAQLAIARDRHFASVAIIARTTDQARDLYHALAKEGATLLVDAHTPYSGGIVVTTPFVVKGFEFDQVILPDAGEANYGQAWDGRLLYIGATRALHRLCIFYSGAPSPHLKTE